MLLTLRKERLEQPPLGPTPRTPFILLEETMKWSWRSWAPWWRGAALPTECSADKSPRPVCAHGQHKQLFNHFKLKCRLWAGENHCFWQLGKNVGVGERDGDISSGKDRRNCQEEPPLLRNCCSLTIIPGAWSCALVHHKVGEITDS